jgi:hypothetical protein
MVRHPEVTLLRAADDTFKRWVAENNVRAVLVRPDRYVHEGFSDPTAVSVSISDLAHALLPDAAEATCSA